MNIVYYDTENDPLTFSKSIFLAGPTPREASVDSWRPEAIKELEAQGFDGSVFVPEYEGKGFWDRTNWERNLEWETEHLKMADVILFWVPRNMDNMQGLTTNDEWGTWKFSGKAVWGSPEKAERVSYQKYFANKIGLPELTTLKDTVAYTIAKIGDGVSRTAAERYIPIDIFTSNEFRGWYRNQKTQGNQLEDAAVEWTFRVGKNKEFLFCWVLYVNVYIAQEDRFKQNEFILGRPDISTIVLYAKPNNPRNILDTKIGLIKEFRSPMNNKLGYVFEPPGGSTFNKKESVRQIAIHELEEETGLKISPFRFKYIDSRQLAATLSVHKSHVYAVQLEPEEFKYLEDNKGPHGVVEDSERTYLQVVTLRDIVHNEEVCDYASVGMIFNALYK